MSGTNVGQADNSSQTHGSSRHHHHHHDHEAKPRHHKHKESNTHHLNDDTTHKHSHNHKHARSDIVSYVKDMVQTIRLELADTDTLFASVQDKVDILDAMRTVVGTTRDGRYNEHARTQIANASQDAQFGHLDVFLTVVIVLEGVRACVHDAMGTDILATSAGLKDKLKTLHGQQTGPNTSVAVADELLNAYWSADSLTQWIAAVQMRIKGKASNTEIVDVSVKLQQVQLLVKGVMSVMGIPDFSAFGKDFCALFGSAVGCSDAIKTSAQGSPENTKGLSTTASDYVILILALYLPLMEVIKSEISIGFSNPGRDLARDVFVLHHSLCMLFGTFVASIDSILMSEHLVSLTGHGPVDHISYLRATNTADLSDPTQKYGNLLFKLCRCLHLHQKKQEGLSFVVTVRPLNDSNSLAEKLNQAITDVIEKLYHHPQVVRKSQVQESGEAASDGPCGLQLPVRIKKQQQKQQQAAPNAKDDAAEGSTAEVNMALGYLLARLLESLPAVISMLSISQSDVLDFKPPLVENAQLDSYKEYRTRFVPLLFVSTKKYDLGKLKPRPLDPPKYAARHVLQQPDASESLFFYRRSDLYRMCIGVSSPELDNSLSRFTDKVRSALASMSFAVERQKALAFQNLIALRTPKVIGYIKIGNRKEWSRRFNVHLKDVKDQSSPIVSTTTFKISYSETPDKLHQYSLKYGVDLLSDDPESMHKTAGELCEKTNKGNYEEMSSIFADMSIRPSPSNTLADSEIVVGPFSKVFFNPELKAADMADQCSGVKELLEKGKDILVFGFGVSGAGKTSTLVQLVRNGKVEPGLVQKWVSDLVLGDLLGDLRVFALEIYMKFSAPPPGDGSAIPDDNVLRKPIAKEVDGILPFVHSGGQAGSQTRTYATMKEINGAHKDVKDAFISSVMQRILVYIDDQRVILPTSNNPNSSRSHVVLSLYLGQRTVDGKTRAQFMHIADLAGSENRFNDQDATVRKRFKELLTKRGDGKLDQLFQREYKDGDVVRAPNPLKAFKLSIQKVEPVSTLKPIVEWNVKTGSDQKGGGFGGPKGPSKSKQQQQPSQDSGTHKHNENLMIHMIPFVGESAAFDDRLKILVDQRVLDTFTSEKRITASIEATTNVMLMRSVEILKNKSDMVPDVPADKLKTAVSIIVDTIVDSLGGEMRAQYEEHKDQAKSLVEGMKNWETDISFTKTPSNPSDAEDAYELCWLACKIFKLFQKEKNKPAATNGPTVVTPNDNLVYHSMYYAFVMVLVARSSADSALSAKLAHLWDWQINLKNHTVLMYSIFKTSERFNRQTGDICSFTYAMGHTHLHSSVIKMMTDANSKFIGIMLGGYTTRQVLSASHSVPQTLPDPRALELAYIVVKMVRNYEHDMDNLVTSYMRNCTYEGVVINRELDAMRADLRAAVAVQILEENPLMKPMMPLSCMGALSHPLMGEAFNAMDSAAESATSQSLIFGTAYHLSFLSQENATALASPERGLFNYESFIAESVASSFAFRAGDYIVPVAMCVMNLDASIKDPPTPFIDTTRLRDAWRLYKSIKQGPIRHLLKDREASKLIRQLGLSGDPSRVADTVIDEMIDVIKKMIEFPEETMSILKGAKAALDATKKDAKNLDEKEIMKFLTSVEKFSSSSIIGNILFVDTMCKLGAPASCYLSRREPCSSTKERNEWTVLVDKMTELTRRDAVKDVNESLKAAEEMIERLETFEADSCVKFENKKVILNTERYMKKAETSQETTPSTTPSTISSTTVESNKRAPNNFRSTAALQHCSTAAKVITVDKAGRTFKEK